MILTKCCCWVGYDTTNISCCRSWYFNWMSGGNILHFTAMYYVETHLYQLIRQPYYVVLVYGSYERNVLSNIVNVVYTFSVINIAKTCFS